MGKNTCDGDVYIHNLSSFIKSHEPQLANALVAYKKLNSTTNNNNNNNNNNNKTNNNTPTSNTKNDTDESNNTDSKDTTTNNNNSIQNGNISIDEEDKLTKEISKPVRLSLSLHHLYFILGRFKDLGIPVGPMNLRLENIDSISNSNYVSFLSEFQRNKKLDSDTQSIHSISSVKSVMSSVSALWNNFGSTSKIDSTVSDLKYLYSAFSKLPCLRLANEQNSKLIEGHQEYPFETATPIVIFKNLLVLEISDLEPKEIFGWHILSTKLRYLVVKKANVTDPIEIFINLVEADSTIKSNDDSLSMENNNSNNNNNMNINNSNNDINFNDNKFPHYDDEYYEYDNNKLTKSKSNSSDPNDRKFNSNIPSSHSTLNLSTHLLNSKNNHTSPNLLQSQSIIPSIHSHSPYSYNYSLNQHYKLTPHIHNSHAYNSHNNNLNNNNNTYNNHDYLQSISTSPTSSAVSYHPTRLYSEDVVNSQQTVLSSSVNSTRRSYYYKPHTKSRRSRGSTSLSTPIASHSSINYHESHSKSRKSDEVDHNYIYNNKITSNNNNNNNTNNNNNHIYNNNNNNFYNNSNNNNNHHHQQHQYIHNHSNINLDSSIGNDNYSKLKKSPLLDSQTSGLNPSSWSLLKHLSLTENKIEKLSLGSFDYLINLTVLDLSYNRLTQIPEAPLSKLVNLKTLNLSFNKLFNTQTFPKNLKKLTMLNLRGNKITQIDSIENLSSLSKIDLRQNNIYKVTDLKPLLLINKEKVMITSIYLSGNPVSKSRGYRVELFNLFNGIEYENSLKIDGSRPGIFESRMLLDEKTANMRFKNYLDESIISKMTASVSNMNLSNILNKNNNNLPVTIRKDSNSSRNETKAAFIKIESNNNNKDSNNDTSNKDNKVNDNISKISNNVTKSSVGYPHPILDQMSTSINVSADAIKITRQNISHSPTVASLASELMKHDYNNTNNNNNNVNNIINGGDINEHVIAASPIVPTRNPLAVTLRNNSNSNSDSNMASNLNPPNFNRNNSLNNLNDFIVPVNRSLPHSQRTSNDFSTTSSIITSTGVSINPDNNPITRLTLASPALPVITQATTTTMTSSNKLVSNSNDSSSIHTNKDHPNGDNLENKENIPKKTFNDETTTTTNDEYSKGLKISVS